MAAKEKLNGSVDRLAEALRDVVREAAHEAMEPLRKEMKAGFEQVDKELSELRGELTYARKEAELQR